MFLLVLGLYWLYGWRPFLIHAELIVDDFLHIRHAYAFLNWLQGRSPAWLGPFDYLCLAKTPLYGVWLALLNLLGIPLRIGEFLILLAGPFLFARAVRPVTRLLGWRFACVAVLLVANPLFPGDFRPHREGLQVSLANLCLISTVGMVLRGGSPRWDRWRWAAMAGFFFGLCYINREEAIWLLAPLSFAFGIMLLPAAALWRQGGRVLLSSLGSRGLVLAFVCLGFLPPVLAVCALNQQHYGVFLTTFRRSSALIQLVQRLTSLEPEGHQPNVHIARPTRMKAYELSPTFARFKPSLEMEGGLWSAGNPIHSLARGRSPAEREIFVSTFEVALPYAAEQAGARTPKQMEEMFVAIDRELGDAIRAGKIRAGAHAPSALPPLRPGDRGRILAAWWRGFASLLTVEHVPYYWPDVMLASRAELDDLQRLTSSAVVLYPKPNWQARSRAWVFDGTKRVQRIAYPVLFLSWFGLLLMRRKAIFTLAASPRGLLVWSGVIPLAGLGAFSLGMAVVGVLCYQFFHLTGVYNQMGFGPLSVFCACTFVGLTLYLPRDRA